MVRLCGTCKHEEKSISESPCSECNTLGNRQLWEAAVKFGEDSTAVHSDNVNHPKHYETGKFECIDVMTEAIGVEYTKGFCLCNAFKYIYRCTNKHESPVEDVKKAVWYLNKFVELEGENHGNLSEQN